MCGLPPAAIDLLWMADLTCTRMCAFQVSSGAALQGHLIRDLSGLTDRSDLSFIAEGSGAPPAASGAFHALLEEISLVG